MINLECHRCGAEITIHCLSPTCDLAVCSRCQTLLSRTGRRRERPTADRRDDTPPK
ncbi:MAG: hypothetical protein AB1679_30370 [Actinomycetota bacterium]|jgi:uncharacterized paraquat-inducible protein A